MPFLAYMVVVGSALLGLLFAAEQFSGPPEPMRMSSNFEGLPKPFKAPPEAPKPRPDVTVQAAAAPASPSVDSKKAEAATQKAHVVASASKKNVKTAQASNKKKATRIVRAPREPREVYAQSYYDSEFRGFGRFFW